MTAITPSPAGSAEQRLDAAAAGRLDAAPAALPGAAWDPDHIAEEYLPVLAWALSLDEWNPGWDVQTQRDTIRGAIDAHRLKGTAGGVKGVLERVGAISDYTERPNGAPFTASITVRNQGSLRISDATALPQLIAAHKRGTVHIDLTLLSELFGDVLVAGGIGATVLARRDLALDARPPLRLSGELPIAAGHGAVTVAAFDEETSI